MRSGVTSGESESRKLRALGFLPGNLFSLAPGFSKGSLTKVGGVAVETLSLELLGSFVVKLMSAKGDAAEGEAKRECASFLDALLLP